MPGGYNALMAYPPRDKEDSSFSFFDSEVVPGTRGTIFPAAQYTDGQYHLAWPGLIAQPIEGFNAMWERGDEANISNPDALDRSSRESFDAAGLAATGGLAAGMVGAVPEGAVAANGIGGKLKGWFGREPAVQTERPLDYSQILDDLPHGEQIVGATGQPYSAKVYRGSMRPELEDSGYFDRVGLYASSSPAEAAGFAYPNAEGTAKLSPLQVSFKNPMVIDAEGADFSSVPLNGDLRDIPSIGKMARRKGHDGLVVNNVFEQLAPNTTAVALKPGTVRSALTGDLLYSNSPNAASVPLALNAMERARGSKFWPEWGDAHPERATYFVADEEARAAWRDAVSRVQQQNPHFTPQQAQSAAMQADPEAGQMLQLARRALLENHKGRPLTKGEEVWESLDRPPGSPDATPQELMDTTVRENFMVLGHPELGRKKISGPDTFANHPFASASPLAFTDQQDQQNALMPTSLSKKEKDHHSLNQPRTASGQFTR